MVFLASFSSRFKPMFSVFSSDNSFFSEGSFGKGISMGIVGISSFFGGATIFSWFSTVESRKFDKR